jgi:intracellular septation protein A
VNAAATVMLVATLGAIAITWVVYRRLTRSRGEQMTAAGLAEL